MGRGGPFGFGVIGGGRPPNDEEDDAAFADEFRQHLHDATTALEEAFGTTDEVISTIGAQGHLEIERNLKAAQAAIDRALWAMDRAIPPRGD